MPIEFRELFSDQENKRLSTLIYETKDIWATVYVAGSGYRWDVLSRKDSTICIHGPAKSMEEGKAKATSVLNFIKQFNKEFPNE